MTGAPSVGHDTFVAAIGDVHGCGSQLALLHDAILAAAAAGPWRRRVLVYLGDYVDRGPDSAGVVEALAAGPLAGFEAVHLRGNHEALLQGFLDGEEAWPWLDNGGVATCRSYGLEPDVERRMGGDEALRRALRAALPASHRRFLDRLVLTHAEGDYLFVHAGLRPGLPLAHQEARDLLWIRGAFLRSEADFGALVVHGHTPTEWPEVRPNRIGIDTGACYGGALTALVLEGAARRFLQAPSALGRATRPAEAHAPRPFPR